MENKPSAASEAAHLFGITLFYATPPSCWIYYANVYRDSPGYVPGTGLEGIPLVSRLICLAITIMNLLWIAVIANTTSERRASVALRIILAIVLSTFGILAANMITHGTGEPSMVTFLAFVGTLATGILYLSMDKLVNVFSPPAITGAASRTTPKCAVPKASEPSRPMPTKRPDSPVTPYTLKLAPIVAMLSVPIFSWQFYGWNVAHDAILAQASGGNVSRAVLDGDTRTAIIATVTTIACGCYLLIPPQSKTLLSNAQGLLARLMLAVFGLGFDVVQGFDLAERRQDLDLACLASTAACLLFSGVLLLLCVRLGGYPLHAAAPGKRSDTSPQDAPARQNPTPGPDEIVIDGRVIKAYTDDEWKRACEAPHKRFRKR